MSYRKITAVVIGKPGCCDTYVNGSNGIKDIELHSPQGPGDTTYVDVHYNDGSMTREFYIMQIRFSAEREMTP